MKNPDSKKNNVIILCLKEPDNNDAESKEVLFAEEDATLETLFNDIVGPRPQNGNSTFSSSEIQQL